MKDTYGNNLTGSGGPVVVLTNFGTMSSTTNNGDGTYKATLTSSATTGTATVTATVNSATITDNASVAFIAGGINKFSVTMSGGTTLLSAAAKTAGTPFQVRVTAQDVNGNTVTGYTGSVSLTSNAFGATIPASISTGGFVDLVSVTPTIAGSGDRTISASDGITVTSNASGNFTVNPGAASSLVFVQSPGNSVAGALLSPQPVVEVRDQYANPVTGLSGNVTIAIGNNAGGATLSGTATRPLNTSTARATFTNLSLDKTGTAYTLTASSAVAPSSGTSASFNITPAAAYALVFVQSPSNSIASSLLTPQPIVELQDQFGNAVTNQSGNVTVAIGTNPGGGSLTGTKTLPLNTATAQAVYTNLSINKVGVGYTLISSGGVAPHGDTSAAFTITTASASTIALVSGDGQSAPINRSLSSALVVKVTDAGANPVSGVTVVFSVDSIPAGATGQSVSPLSAVTDVNGLASTSLHLGNKVGRYAVGARSTGLAGSPVFFGATATTGAAAFLSLTSGDNASGVVSTPLSTPFVVTVTDSGANPVSGVTVNYSLDSIPSGATGSSLNPASPATGTDGRASATLTPGSKMGRYVVGARADRTGGKPCALPRQR